MRRELTAYEEACLKQIEDETYKAAYKEAHEGCRAVLAGHRQHVFLRRPNQDHDGIHDAGRVWALVVCQYKEADIAIVGGAHLTPDPIARRRAGEIMDEAIEVIATEHAEASVERELMRAMNQMLQGHTEMLT